MVYVSNRNQYVPIDQLTLTDQCETIFWYKITEMLIKSTDSKLVYILKFNIPRKNSVKHQNRPAFCLFY